MEGRLAAKTEEENKKAVEQGIDTTKILKIDDMCKGNKVFFAATGVSNGDILKGVRFYAGGAATNSLVMREESGTIRYIETYHKWAPHKSPEQALNGDTL